LIKATARPRTPAVVPELLVDAHHALAQLDLAESW
jgi:hypothetical protein